MPLRHLQVQRDHLNKGRSGGGFQKLVNDDKPIQGRKNRGPRKLHASRDRRRIRASGGAFSNTLIHPGISKRTTARAGLEFSCVTERASIYHGIPVTDVLNPHLPLIPSGLGVYLVFGHMSNGPESVLRASGCLDAKVYDPWADRVGGETRQPPVFGKENAGPGEASFRAGVPL